MVKVFAPVNIAWIKYMGKHRGGPVNASLSLTLEHTGTHTQLRKIAESKNLSFTWSDAGYVPPAQGREKAEQFLLNRKLWTAGFEDLGYQIYWPNGIYEIETRNNVPAGTGIATSASGFAALTLAWVGILMGDQFAWWKKQFSGNRKLRAKVGELAKMGSGSAGRSLDGPWVEWDPKLGIQSIDGGKLTFTDFILLIEDQTKAVSSSEAHVRVQTSPHFSGRATRADARLAQVKAALLLGDMPSLSETVLDEALDMHGLFESSVPPFTYLREASREWIARVKEKSKMLPSQNVVLTLDAGANVHLLVPTSEETIWEKYLNEQKPFINYVKARGGRGANYVD